MTALALYAIRGAFQVVGRVAPVTVARWADDLFFRPPRARPHPGEAEFLASGTRSELQTSQGALAAWTWGTGPRVLLVHGWGSRAARFRVLAPALVTAGFQVMAYDHPAHGASPGRHTSVVDVTATLLEVVQQIGVPFGAVGHSLGGAAVAWGQARGLGLQRAALIAPFAVSPAFVERYARTVWLPDRARDIMVRNIEARFQLRFEDLYVPPKLRELQTPVLVVHDREDPEIPIADGRAIAEAWPGAVLEETTGLGHREIMRDPDVSARVTAFMREGL